MIIEPTATADTTARHEIAETIQAGEQARYSTTRRADDGHDRSLGNTSVMSFKMRNTPYCRHRPAMSTAATDAVWLLAQSFKLGNTGFVAEITYGSVNE